MSEVFGYCSIGSVSSVYCQKSLGTVVLVM